MAVVLLACAFSTFVNRPFWRGAIPFASASQARNGMLVRCRAVASDGLDAEADAVGPGIFGGRVERYANGSIVIGRQFEDHNSLPGPVYAGGGYTDINAAIRVANLEKVSALLRAQPDLANEISTGGARPLHVCGMSQTGQRAASLLVQAGAELDARDTWGYTPLQRMATNNLALAADVLVRAGASHLIPSGTEGTGDSARELARRLRSFAVLRVFQQFEEENGIPWPEGEPRL